jgi:hypothetical protein
MIPSGDNSTASVPPTLVVLAAGMGSRFGSLKQVAGLGPAGETVLEYSVYDAIRAGFSKVVFVIRKDFETLFRESVGAKFEKRIDTAYAFQDLTDLPDPFRPPAGRTKPWGTAHAVLAARSQVKTPFAVINADDFYGADSFVQLARFLKAVPSERTVPEEFCMVAYELGRTLSVNGTVSRGICRVGADGTLLSITEREKIRTGTAGPEAQGENRWEPLDPATPVSMNMMGFTPALFAMLAERFRVFLAARGTEMSSECYLPESITHAIGKGQASVRVLRTSGDWMGITYANDKADFSRRILEKIRLGEYPNPLWI